MGIFMRSSPYSEAQKDLTVFLLGPHTPFKVIAVAVFVL